MGIRDGTIVTKREDGKFVPYKPYNRFEKVVRLLGSITVKIGNKMSSYHEREPYGIVYKDGSPF